MMTVKSVYNLIRKVSAVHIAAVENVSVRTELTAILMIRKIVNMW